MSAQRKLYLTKRSNGYYYVGYFDNSRLRWKTTQQKTKPEALEFLKQFQPNTEPVKEEMTLSQLLDSFSQLHGASLRCRTLAGYEDSTKEFVRIIGDKLISQYTSADVETFKNTLLANKLTATTVNIRYRSVKAVFGFALRHEYLLRSPFARTSSIKTAQKTPMYLTKEDLHALLTKVKNSTLRDLFLFAALTGLRLAEITNLKWCSFANNQIVVKNDETFTTKSGKQRTVPCHPVVIEILKRREAQRRNSEYIFAKRSSGAKFSESYVSHQFKHYVTKAKLDSRLHFHSLRHTTASTLVNAGVSIYEVQKLLGHSSVSTTMVYSHLAESRLTESMNRLDL